MDLLDRLLGHDRFATHQLLEIAASLSGEQLDREFDLGHRTIRKTFEHVVWNIECWTDLMRGIEVRRRPDSMQSIAELAERHATASLELLQWAREIVEQDRLDEMFVDTLEECPGRKSLGGAIVHLATHGMHHRAQLLFMFRLIGVSPLPEGDTLSWESQAREV